MKRLWHNGTIYTMAREGETVEAVLVDGETIAAVGARAELAPCADEEIDLRGAALYPGFVDSHLHLIGYGETLLRLDLTGARSAEDVLELAREAARDLPAGRWLVGEGWNETGWSDRRLPTMQQLDAVWSGPVYLKRTCRHVALGNSAALAAAGIDERTAIPGGRIGKGPDGKRNGLLYDRAIDPLLAALAKSEAAESDWLDRALGAAVEDLLARGLTGAHSEDLHYYGHFSNPLAAYERAIGKRVHFRAHLLRHHLAFEEMERAGASPAHPLIEFGAVKLFADGSFGGWTAALSTPYADRPGEVGLLMHTDEQLAALVRRARSCGQAVAVHAIGDAAAAQVLRAIESDPAPAGTRDRLIHACLVNLDLIERMACLPLVADIQPGFVASDFPAVAERLGAERLPYAYAWKSLLDAGVLCAAGTDAPIESPDPLAAIYAAVERKANGAASSGYRPEQKLSRFEAIGLYTKGSAQAIGKEGERGQIQPGFAADFSAFDRDLFAGTAEEMARAEAVQTTVAGRIAFERATGTAKGRETDGV